MKRIKLTRTSFGWYAHGIEIKPSSIPGSYNLRYVATNKKHKVVGMKEVRKCVEIYLAHLELKKAIKEYYKSK